MKKFLLKLAFRLMRSKFSPKHAHRLTLKAEPARIRLRQWLLQEPSTVQALSSGGLRKRLEFLRQALRRWLLSDAVEPATSAESQRLKS